MSIRPLRAQDVQNIESIYDLYWHDDFRKHLLQKLEGFVGGEPEIVDQDFRYLVAEDNQNVLGLAALRRAPLHMLPHARTENPAELYVIAVRERGNGTGSTLLKEIEETARNAGYTEIVLFSSEAHQDSWSFYDASGYEQASEMAAPNGERGRVWRKELQ